MKKAWIYSLIVIINILLLFSSDIFAQKDNKDCKYAKDVIDEFTKKRVVYTKANILYDETNADFSGISAFINESFKISLIACCVNTNGTNSIYFDYAAYNYPPDFTGSYNMISILLENSEVINLKLNKKSEFYIEKDWEHNWVMVKITDSAWEKLKLSPLKQIRLQLINNRQHTLEIRKKYKNKLMEGINCIDALEIPKPINIDSKDTLK